MTKQAWRDVPAGRDLDRIVAGRLGWTVSKRSVAWQLIPHYSTSVEVALTLPIPNGAFRLIYDEALDFSSAYIVPSIPEPEFDVAYMLEVGRAADLPTLMVYAWLTYKEADDV